MSRLNKHIKALDYCTYCPKLCTFACPVSNAENRESVTPWAKMTLANLFRKNKLELTKENAEPLYHCLACRLCTTYCKHEIDVAEVLSDARAMLIDKGIVHPKLAELREKYMSHGNVYGESGEERLKTLLDEEYFIEEAEAIYLPGSLTVFERPQEVKASFSVFEKLGIDFVSCDDGNKTGTGFALYRAGLRKEFEEYAKKLATKLYGYKLIITPCAETAYTLKALYLELGINIGGRVKHILEFLAPYIENTGFEKTLDDKAVYHDAGYLSRFLSMEKLPREIYKKIYNEESLEMVWNKKAAYPSGKGAVYSYMYPEYSKKIAKERLRMAKEVRAEVIVTASSSTAAYLESARCENDCLVRTMTEDIDSCL